MKQLVILSGKGGTGKTSIAAALAVLAACELELVLVDADADAANLALLLAGPTVEVGPFFGADLPTIDPERCMGCLACVDVCRPGALTATMPPTVDAVACEGCRACALECPEGAIRMVRVRSGAELRTASRAGPLFHGDLLPGQENTGKLVAALRSRARDEVRGGDALVLIDGPPGIGCPALAASTGTDLALLVAEPSLSALHDLERILDTVTQLGIPAVACLNKADLQADVAERIRGLLRERDVPLLAEIPFSERVGEAVEAGRPLPDLDDTDLVARIVSLWTALRHALR